MVNVTKTATQDIDFIKIREILSSFQDGDSGGNYVKQWSPTFSGLWTTSSAARGMGRLQPNPVQEQIKLHMLTLHLRGPVPNAERGTGPWPWGWGPLM